MQVCALRVNVLANHRLEAAAAHVGDHHGRANLARLAGDKRQERRLVRLALRADAALVTVPITRLATDLRFIRDNPPGQQSGEWIAFHGLTDAMQHKPR